MPSKAFRRLLCVLLLLAGIGAAVFFAARGPQKPLAAVELSDGRILQIEAISFGTNHQVGRKSPLIQSVGPWLPRKVNRFFSPKVPHAEINVSEPKLVVWVNALDAKTRQHVDCQSLRLEFVDEHGDLFGEETRHWFGGEKFWRVGHRFPAFPRSERSLTLQITPWPKKNQPEQSVRVRLPNHFTSSPRQWIGGDLPLSQTVGEYELVLAELVESVRGGTNKYWETRSRYWEPRWELRKEGTTVVGLDKPEWTAEDPFGNHGKYLGVRSPVLRYSVTVYPTVTSTSAVLAATLPTVPVTELQSNVWWNQTFQFGTNEIFVFGFLAAGSHVFSEGLYQTNPPAGFGPVGGGAPSGWTGQTKQVTPLRKQSWSGHYTPVPTLYIRAASLPDKQRWAMRLRDDEGRLWPTEPEPQGHPHNVRPFLAKLPPDIPVVTPEIVILNPLRAEFTVKTPVSR